MTTESTTKDEREDRKRRTELQSKLQEAIRRSAPASELRKIEQQIEALNAKLEAYGSWTKKVGTP